MQAQLSIQVEHARLFHEGVDLDTAAAQEGVGHELQWSDVDVAAAAANQFAEMRV
jgi:hypothetical protein